MIPYKQHFKHLRAGCIILENLILKRHENKLIVLSDESDQKKQRNETFRNKNKLKEAGFRWDPNLNSWTIDQAQLQRAQQILQGINKTAKEKFIDKIEEIPEFIRGTENLSKKDELIQKIDGFIDELSLAVDTALSNEQIKKFIEFNAKFKGYSFHNTLLIFLQKPDATRVAGYRQWEEKFHRSVKKGAIGISILAPIRQKVSTDTTSTVPTAPTPQAGAIDATSGVSDDGDKKDRSYIRFMAVTVFDISDTEPIDERGEIVDPVWHGSNEPNQKANELFDCAVELANDMGIKVEREKSHGKEQGWANANDHINITSEIDGVNKAATLIHEIAHELLHFKKSSPFYIGDDESTTLSKEAKELQAESVSFIVIKYYELPADHQATYVALWKGNKDAVKENFSVIKRTSNFIIGELDKIQDAKKKSQEPPTEPPTEPIV